MIVMKMIDTGATFSPCRKYRYGLHRVWSNLAKPRYAMFIGLNPSTADETLDDPTIRRCITYARDWGYDGYIMGNIFAYRATKPEVMKACPSPIGDDNDVWLKHLVARSEIVIAAWGTHGTHLGRGDQVRSLIPNLHVLQLTKDGHPNHPLYLKKTLTPVRWES